MDRTLLEPKALRSGEKYIPLKNFDFKAADKTFIGEILLGKHGDIIGPIPAVAELAKRHDLSRSTVRNWVDHVKNGKIMHDNGGNPRRLDEQSNETITSEIKKARKAKKPLSKVEIKQLVIRDGDEEEIRLQSTN